MITLCILTLLFLPSSFGAIKNDPSNCNSYPCLIFKDDFDYLDNDIWSHEIFLGGGGNKEFEAYVNNRSVTFVKDGNLFIKPQLTADWRGEDFLYNGVFDLWGMNGRNDVCTGNYNDGCKRSGTKHNPGGDINNPIMSGRIRTLGRFSFTYGRVEVKAKLPRGDYLWPAIWLLPDDFSYGGWPASGEIDIVEARGNDEYGDISNSYAGNTVHWGPYFHLNRYPWTHSDYQTEDKKPFPDDFHTWTFDWTPDNMTWYLDGKQTLFVDPITNFWDHGNFTAEGGPNIDNPWQGRGKMAPFDKKFSLIMCVAVGGTLGYFPEDPKIDPKKPYSNASPTPMKDFWENRSETWLPTWMQGENEISDGAALQVDYIQVHKMTAEGAPDQKLTKSTKETMQQETD